MALPIVHCLALDYMQMLAKIIVVFSLWPDKVEDYVFYNFFSIFRSAIKVWGKKHTTNTINEAEDR
jgi:hypothetical protein